MKVKNKNKSDKEETEVTEKTSSPKKTKSNKPIGLIEKKYFNIYGISKHYVKFEREQIESKDPNGQTILIFADTKENPMPEECPYYDNLPESEVKKMLEG